jgi:hypothetical protein
MKKEKQLLRTHTGKNGITNSLLFLAATFLLALRIDAQVLNVPEAPLLEHVTNAVADYNPGTDTYVLETDAPYSLVDLTAERPAFAGGMLSGNGEIITRIDHITSGGYAGITIRESLDPGARHFTLLSDLSNFIRVEYREATKAPRTTKHVRRSDVLWLKIVREGNRLTAYTSREGNYWTMAAEQSMPMPPLVYAGLIAFSADEQSTAIASFTEAGIYADITGLAQDRSQTYRRVMEPAMEIFPNPSDGTYLQVDLFSPVEENTWIRLFDSSGRKLWQRNITVRPGYNNEIIHPGDLATGVYWVAVTLDKESIARKVVVGQRLEF